MSRIARVLEKAELERTDVEVPRQPRRESELQPRATDSDASRVRVPWQLDDDVPRIDPRHPRRAAHGQPRPRAAHQITDGRDREYGGQNSLVRGPRRLPAPYSTEGLSLATPPPPEPPSLVRYWHVGKRRWRTGLLILLVIVAGVVAGLLLQTPTYTATGLLEIRPESTGAAVPVQTLFDPSKMATDDLETQYGILRSDSVAERVLAQMARNGTPALPRPSAWSLSSVLRFGNRAPAATPSAGVPTPADIKRFHQALLVDPQRGSRLVAVAYTSPDGKVAALTVNAVLDHYLQLRMEEAQRTQQWLEQQLQTAQQKLEGSEGRLQEYIRAHGIQVVETGKGEAAQMANERLQALHDLLAKAEAERFEKQSEEEQGRRLSAPRDVDSPVVQSLTVRLADLRREQAMLASTFKEDYPALKALTNQIHELEQQLSEESRFVVTRGQREYQAAVRREGLLRSALDEQNKIVQALAGQSADHAGYQSLKNELTANQDQFTLLNQKVKEAGISAALRASSVGIVDRARPPLDADGLPLPLTVALTAVVGLALAIGGVMMGEYFDTSMRTVADVRSLGVRALGAIPAVGADLRPASSRGALPRRREWRRIDDSEQQSALAEAFAALRNAVLVQDEAATSSRVLLVTSAQSEEGKTTVSINLALSLARLNYRVLLIDANMRFPCVQQALGLPDAPGLVDYLVSGGDWHGSLHHDVRPNLDVLAGDRPDASPADLLSLPPMARMLDQAASEYDFVLLDSPALLAHPADVHSLAAVVDNVLFTVRQGTTPRETVSLALSQLDRVSGIVLNRFGRGEAGFHWEDVRPTLAPDQA